MVTRLQVLSFRVRAQQLDLATNSVAGAAVLDLGVQDTGSDGGTWALAIRGVDGSALNNDRLARVWTIRGAPHLYRRQDLASVAAAVAPFSDADAGKRIFDASKPLNAAGITNFEALDAVSAAMRSIVTEPMGKGEVSSRLADVMDEPYLRFCRVCDATHLYEMPFRLAALRAGLELEADTAPPVLRRIPDFEPADHVPKRYDVVRGYLRLVGPATARAVAEYLDAPISDVLAHWPKDAVEVSVAGEKRWILGSDEDRLGSGRVKETRLLGPFDLFLQARDRSLIVPDPAHAKALWPRLGRPGAVLLDGDIAGTWRPRKSGMKLVVRVDLWSRTSTAASGRVVEQAERLAAHRGVDLSRVDFAS
jgi:Winged helix DNA-binding domain